MRRLICLATFVLATTAPGVTSPAPRSVRPSPAIESADTITRYYTLTVRFRPLLFWMTRDDVGGARISWNSSPGPDSWLELLVGSDPDRAPMSINRWGFISEQTQGATTRLTGIMTELDEGWIDGARRNPAIAVDGAGGFRGIRSTVRNGEAITSIVRLPGDPQLTYRDYTTLLDRLPSGAAGTQRLRLRTGVQPGFLTAMKSLVHESVETWQRERRLVPGRTLQHDYVYAGKLYQLSLCSATPLTGAQADRGRRGPAVDGEFQIRNAVTGTTTDFHIVYGLAGTDAETPFRLVYRPRWWIELELDLVAPDASRLAMSDLPRPRNPLR